MATIKIAASEKEIMSKTHYALLVLVTLTVMLCLAVLDRTLQNEVAPYGIVSFEFVGTMENFHDILDSWSDNARLHAGIILGLDYLFLCLYPATIGFACRHCAIKMEFVSLLRRLGVTLAWAQPVAGALDGVENYALIRLLLGSKWTVWPSIAWWCALVKFAVVMNGIAYILMATAMNMAAPLCDRKLKPKYH